MLKQVFQRVSLTCVVRMKDTFFSSRAVATTPRVDGGYRRYDRSKDSVRQGGLDSDEAAARDTSVLPHDKLFSSFPTLETHSQMFEGVKFTDLPIVHIKATSNNTVISITNGDGKVLAHQSAGTVGFRNARKGTNVAAQAAAIALAGDAQRKDVTTVRVCLKGIGPGRLPALKALQLSGLNVISITDTTPLAHNGNRPKKARRL